MNVKFAKRAAIASGVAVLSLGMIAPMAQADPPVTTPQTFRELVGVGSDTTQDVVNGLGNVIVDPNNSPSHFLIASYNAVDPVTGVAGGNIVTRSGHAAIVRPNGSGAGVTALANDIASGANNLDFARSSSGPSVTTGNGTWIPFAVDAVAPAVKAGSTLPGDFTLTQLQRIYNCQDPATGTALAAGAFPVIGGVTVHPLVPQPGSGTRKFWASTLGFSATTLPGCVSDHALNGTSVEEHDGSGLQRTVAANGSEDLAPFSIAQWIAQANHTNTGSPADVIDRRHGALLRTVNSVATTTGTPAVLNTSFPIKREVYNVFLTTRLTETDIKNAFVTTTTTTAKVCANTATINLYGFGTDSNCGSTVLHGPIA